MHHRNSSEAPEYVWLAFQRGNYSKVVDISGFCDRMRLSHQLAECQSQMGHLLFLLRARSLAEVRAAWCPVTVGYTHAPLTRAWIACARHTATCKTWS